MKVNLEDEEQALILNTLVELDPIHHTDDYPLNDIGASELFSECYRFNTLYCPENKTWYCYNGQKWEKDTQATLVNEKLKDFVEFMQLYLVEIKENIDEKEQKSYLSFIAKLSSRNERDKIIKDAQSCMAIPFNQFDANPYLINCKNGTYDLKTSAYHPFRADDFLTFQTDCNFPVSTLDVDGDRWNEFIDEIMCGDQNLEHYLQKVLGYALDGVNREEKMFIFYGQTTRNGKSTLINSILKVLGDYGTSADVHILTLNGGNQDPSKPNPAICGLKGKRYLSLNETDDNSRLNESLLKNYTGNDPISTRELYGSTFTFVPQFTIFMSGNNLPEILDKSVFTSERVVVIPFNRHFNRDEQDKELKEKFATDSVKTYIFKWLLKGYKMYKQEGLNDAPECVVEQVEQYEKDNDISALFIDEKTESNLTSKVLRSGLYYAFKNYCKANGYLNVKSSQKFYKDVERLGYEIKREADGYFVYGLELKK